MDYISHNLGGLACLLILIIGGIAFWRGLSMKPSEPGSRPRDVTDTLPGGGTGL